VFQPADRQEPGDPASARQELDGAGSGVADDAVGGAGNTIRACPVVLRPMPRNISRAEAGFQACEQAVMTSRRHSATPRKFHVERLLARIPLIPRIAPISPQLILSFIARKGAGPAEVLLAGSLR